MKVRTLFKPKVGRWVIQVSRFGIFWRTVGDADSRENSYANYSMAEEEIQLSGLNAYHFVHPKDGLFVKYHPSDKTLTEEEKAVVELYRRIKAGQS